MSPEKIRKPLDELLGYISHTPVIIELLPQIPVSTILPEVRKVNGKVKSIFYRNNIDIEIRLEHIDFFAKNRNVKKIKFNGNLDLLKHILPKRCGVIDTYLEEIVYLSEFTPVIINTFGGLDELYIQYLNSICSEFQEYPRIKNAYLVTLPLSKIEVLVNIPHILGIEYNKAFSGRYTTRTFLPSTFW